MTFKVVCVPGSVAPAAQRYKPLLDKVGDAADVHLKDLEVYREARPPDDYSIEQELEGLDRFLTDNRLERVHLVAYSAGGFIALAYAATRPSRVLSLGVFEPARLPGKLTDDESAFFSLLEGRLHGLEGPEFMAAFIREQVKPGAVLPPPPPGPVSAEMQKRPAGIAALIRAFDAHPFDRELLRAAAFPVLYGYGDMSHPEQALKAGILAELFADIRIQRFAGVHHFVPPDQIYTPRHVDALQALWRDAEGAAN